MENFLTYHMPPRTKNPDGKERSVGVELEFIGLEAEEAAASVTEALGGDVSSPHPHRFVARDTSLGDITIELDASPVHPDLDNDGQWVQAVRKTLGDIGKGLVPVEVISPPIPISRLSEIDKLTAGLRNAGARGTEAGWTSAFGLHLNPEVPSFGVADLLSMIRAMVICNDELRQTIRPDLTRRVLGWSKPWEDTYQQLVTRPDYQPDLKSLIRDYMFHNKDRNRDLDLMPIFTHMAPDLMASLTGLHDLKGRPTFHYRLPNCLIGQPAWSIQKDWNCWVDLERQAEQLTSTVLRTWRREKGLDA